MGEVLLEQMNEHEKPVWISTAGTGVPFLHVRFDSRPKYYSWDEYKSYPTHGIRKFPTFLQIIMFLIVSVIAAVITFIFYSYNYHINVSPLNSDTNLALTVESEEFECPNENKNEF